MLGYEKAAKEILPAVRSALAKELKSQYHIKEEEISKKLGITQAAVSKYVRNKCSDKIKLVENSISKEVIASCAKDMVLGNADAVNKCVCNVCKSMNDFGCGFYYGSKV